MLFPIHEDRELAQKLDYGIIAVNATARQGDPGDQKYLIWRFKNATKFADCSYNRYLLNKKAVPIHMLVKYTFVKIWTQKGSAR